MDDESSPPVVNVVVEACEFQSGHGMLTCGSEATVIRNVTVRNSVVGAGVPVVRYKLRPDTPQIYENFVFENLQLEQAQALFDVKPWTQFFDLGDHAPPRSVVRNVVVRQVTGTARTLGELRGNAGDLLQQIVLEDVDVEVDHVRFKVGEVEGLRWNNVRVNQEAYHGEP